MAEPRQTILHERHIALGAQMVDFGGWHMPLQYPNGIVEEHLATRRQAGLFDVSHMGRFTVAGPGALPFLQMGLSNDASLLTPGRAQYTMLPTETGGVRDDAYLYRFSTDRYLLVVNAVNRDADWQYLRQLQERFPEVILEDRTEETAMLSLQGPASETILGGVIGPAALPRPAKNSLSVAAFAGRELLVARTGYTGEPLGFECFLAADLATQLWDLLLARGAAAVGLGARDTLRLEASLPLYGHEMGMDPSGNEIPLFACPLSLFAVRFAPAKGAFTGKEALLRQLEALGRLNNTGNNATSGALPRLIHPFALLGKGIARAGFPVFQGERAVGVVTSGTMVPYWLIQGEGPSAQVTQERNLRAIGLMLIDALLGKGTQVEVEIRGSRVPALIVGGHLRTNFPPYALPILR